MSLPGDFKSRASQAPQVSTNATETAAPAVLNEFREIVLAGYNWLTKALRSEEVSPIVEMYGPSIAFVSSSNITSGTLAYYPSSAGISVGSQVDISTQLYLSSSSGSIFVTYEGTNDTSASPRWIDITKSVSIRNLGGTNYLTGSGYVNFSCATGTADFMLDLFQFNYEKWRIKTFIDYSNVNTLGIYVRTKAI
jgi:hypothetical protein